MVKEKARKGVVTFEDFMLALIILSLATALIISNLFIFDHRTVAQMSEQRKVWGSDVAADMVAKRYVLGNGELNVGALAERPMPDDVEVTVGGLHFGGTPPVAGNVFASNRLVIVNGRPERLTVKTW
ncbi:MAG: hypothetical protein WC759_01785 [Candidatus Micrarchaeia archaeon]|jgi:hypothetical protein